MIVERSESNLLSELSSRDGAILLCSPTEQTLKRQWETK